MRGARSGKEEAGARVRARTLLTAHLGYKGAALFFAVVLWIVARAEEPASTIVDVRLALRTAPGVRVVGEMPRVRALIAGRRRSILALTGAAPVLRSEVEAPPAGTGDTVRLEVHPGDIDLPPEVDGAQVRDVRPRALVLHVVAGPARTASREGAP